MVKNVAIVSRPGEAPPHMSSTLLNVVEWLRGHGYNPMFDVNSVWHCRGLKGWTRPEVLSDDELAITELALVITLGGDGTILGASRLFAKNGVPILGVNLGNLGFLSEVPLTDLFPALESWERGEHVLDRRLMLDTEILRNNGYLNSECPQTHVLSLNEAVLSQVSTGKLGEFSVELDFKKVAQFRANGVIVSTPTGSTAYNLAANGPILHPDVDALVVTPICPHLLTLRPLVVRGDSQVTIRVVGEGTATVSADGQNPTVLKTNDAMFCRRSRHTVSLVRMKESGFFEAMRSKMSWGER